MVGKSPLENHPGHMVKQNKATKKNYSFSVPDRPEKIPRLSKQRFPRSNTKNGNLRFAIADNGDLRFAIADNLYSVGPILHSFIT